MDPAVETEENLQTKKEQDIQLKCGSQNSIAGIHTISMPSDSPPSPHAYDILIAQTDTLTDAKSSKEVDIGSDLEPLTIDDQLVSNTTADTQRSADLEHFETNPSESRGKSVDYFHRTFSMGIMERNHDLLETLEADVSESLPSTPLVPAEGLNLAGAIFDIEI